jgi:hypothetical protein
VKYLIGEPSELFPILCENLRESFYWIYKTLICIVYIFNM